MIVDIPSWGHCVAGTFFKWRTFREVQVQKGKRFVCGTRIFATLYNKINIEEKIVTLALSIMFVCSSTVL